MPQIALFTGACRSGKSAMAQAWVEERAARRVYLASARIGDDEMARRVVTHQAVRGQGWTTLELAGMPDPADLIAALREACLRGDAAVLDCTTLWLSTCLEAAWDDARILNHLDAFLATLPQFQLDLALVHNELGWGIVPETALVRRFRDLSGLVGQRIAAAAHSVTLAVCGIAVHVK